MIDWIPVVSQVKSGVYAVKGDKTTAKQTQKNFIKTCPVVSQATSAVQLVSSGEKKALETQKEFVNNMNNFANILPIVGHIKGGIHYAVGDKKGGKIAINRSTRSLGSIGGTAIGMLVGIPKGMIKGGKLGHDIANTMMDGKPVRPMLK